MIFLKFFFFRDFSFCFFFKLCFINIFFEIKFDKRDKLCKFYLIDIKKVNVFLNWFLFFNFFIFILLKGFRSFLLGIVFKRRLVGKFYINK